MFSSFAAVYTVPLMLTEMTAAALETVFHRTALMMSGQCSLTEYDRMVSEKVHALQLSATVAATGGSIEAMIEPYHTSAVANAKRLRNQEG